MKKHNVIPGLLFIYLCGMAYMGTDSLRSGELSIQVYILLIVITLGCIILLRHNLIRREKYRRQQQNGKTEKKNPNKE